MAAPSYSALSFKAATLFITSLVAGTSKTTSPKRPSGFATYRVQCSPLAPAIGIREGHLHLAERDAYTKATSVAGHRAYPVMLSLRVRGLSWNDSACSDGRRSRVRS